MNTGKEASVTNPFKQLSDLIAIHEDWLMTRILEYAKQWGYKLLELTKEFDEAKIINLLTKGG